MRGLFDAKLRVRGRFYLVIALMAISIFTGLSTGFGLFYRLLYILALTTVFSLVWNWLSLRWLDVRAERRTSRVRVGDSVEERITVRNLNAIPKPVLEIEDLTDLPGYSSGMAITLASKGFRSWRTLTPARKRGVYTMGPVRVTNTDAFGLFRRERLFGGTAPLIVYPRTFDVPGFAIPAAYLSGETSTRKRSHNLTPHAGSVRDYASGDSISRVHWNSTARLGKLMSKEFDLGQSSDVWLFVDLHRDVQAGELEESTDEYAVSIAASLGRKYLAAGLPVGFVAYGEQRHFLAPDTGMGQFDRLMESLALSKAEGDTPLGQALPLEEALWGYHSSLVVITASNRPDWTVAIRELTRRRVKVAVVLLDGASFGGFLNTLDVVPDLYDAATAPYVVRQGDDIPAALSHTFTVPEVEEATEELEAKVVRL